MDIVLGHMKQLVWPPEAVFNLHEAKKLTFDIFELQKSYLHVKWSEFHQKFNGHGPGTHETMGLASGGCFQPP